MKFLIVELDKDYHCVTKETPMEFPSKKAADKYCREHSWAGYDYHAIPADKVVNRQPEIDGYPVL